MEVVTHALLGATAALATASDRSRLGLRQRAMLGAAAAAFPDIDYLTLPLNPLLFLADWHQGPTHSLVMLPLWSLLIGGGYVLATRRLAGFREAVTVSAIGLLVHIASDLITVYGAALLSPISDARFAFGTTFLVDPLFTLVIASGLVASLWMRRPLFARLGLAVLCAYVGGQLLLQLRAIDVGRVSLQAQVPGIESLSALPQPFSPFNWKLIAVRGDQYYVAHVNLVGHPPLVPPLPGLRRLADVAESYQAPAHLVWHRRHRLGERLATRGLVDELWHHPHFSAFRRFAVYPGLSRIDGDPGCVWFTDLRYNLPAFPETFRYGFCRDGTGDAWQLYGLRFFSDSVRVRIPPTS